jgi:hypothetical protein
MTTTPSGPSRRQRRWTDRALRKLIRRDGDNCSLCRAEFKHNSRTFGGFDRHGRVVLVGDCCAERLAVIHTAGLFTSRNYDFLDAPRASRPPTTELTSEAILDAVAAYREIISDTDKRFDDILRRGGGLPGMPRISTLDHPWKDDDRIWFEQNPTRSHRARRLFPGEADKEAASAPPGHVMILLLRQVEPGTRLKAGFYLNADALPVPDDEALIHTLFEVAVGHEAMPPDPQAFEALIEKYKMQEPKQ